MASSTNLREVLLLAVRQEARDDALLSHAWSSWCRAMDQDPADSLHVHFADEVEIVTPEGYCGREPAAGALTLGGGSVVGGGVLEWLGLVPDRKATTGNLTFGDEPPARTHTYRAEPHARNLDAVGVGLSPDPQLAAFSQSVAARLEAIGAKAFSRKFGKRQQKRLSRQAEEAAFHAALSESHCADEEGSGQDCTEPMPFPFRRISQALVALEDAAVFESRTSDNQVGRIVKGETVLPEGKMRCVQGFWMISIEGGAVQGSLFRLARLGDFGNRSLECETVPLRRPRHRSCENDQQGSFRHEDRQVEFPPTRLPYKGKSPSPFFRPVENVGATKAGSGDCGWETLGMILGRSAKKLRRAVVELAWRSPMCSVSDCLCWLAEGVWLTDADFKKIVVLCPHLFPTGLHVFHDDTGTWIHIARMPAATEAYLRIVVGCSPHVPPATQHATSTANVVRKSMLGDKSFMWHTSSPQGHFRFLESVFAGELAGATDRPWQHPFDSPREHAAKPFLNHLPPVTPAGTTSVEMCHSSNSRKFMRGTRCHSTVTERGCPYVQELGSAFGMHCDSTTDGSVAPRSTLPLWPCLLINSFLASPMCPRVPHSVVEGGPVIYPLLGAARAAGFLDAVAKADPSRCLMLMFFPSLDQASEIDEGSDQDPEVDEGGFDGGAHAAQHGEDVLQPLLSQATEDVPALLPPSPDWAAVESLLTPLERRNMTMVDKVEWQGFWGKCTLCNALYDADHCASRKHRRRCSWPQASEPATASSESTPAPRRSPHIVEFHPLNWAGEPARGALLVDSFFYMKKKRPNGRSTTVHYLPQLLQDIWDATGMVFIAICSGGAALERPDGQGARFEELLARAPDGLDVVIAIICGNDFLKGWEAVQYRPAWDSAAVALVSGMQAKATRQLVVVGGSAELWGYSWMSPDQQHTYDANARRLCQHFRACGVSATTGAQHLRGIAISDCAGHLDPSSQATVFAAYHAWVAKALASSSPEPAPAPVAPDLPHGWSAVWRDEHQCFSFHTSDDSEATWAVPPQARPGFVVHGAQSIAKSGTGMWNPGGSPGRCYPHLGCRAGMRYMAAMIITTWTPNVVMRCRASRYNRRAFQHLTRGLGRERMASGFTFHLLGRMKWNVGCARPLGERTGMYMSSRGCSSM